MRKKILSSSNLFFLAGLFIFFAIGFIIHTFISIYKPDKIIKLVEQELKVLKEDRDLIKNPQKSGSNLIVDSYFFKSDFYDNQKFRDETLEKYKLELVETESRAKDKICISYKFPEEYYNDLSNWIIFIHTNLDTINKPEGLIDLRDYDNMQFPVKLSIDQGELNARIKLGVVVSKKPGFFANSLPKIQYVAIKDVPVNSGFSENLTFSFKDFKLDQTYQPTISLANLRNLEKISLNANDYKGYLFQIQYSILFSGSLKQGDSITGNLSIGNPVVYRKQYNVFGRIWSYIYGLILSLIYLIFFITYLQYKRFETKKIEIDATRIQINKKEIEIKELSESISRKLEIEKEIIKGLRGYYHWEINAEYPSEFKGINKEDFFSDKFLNSFFFENYKKDINDKTIILIIDYDFENQINHNYLFYYNPDGSRIKFPSINITRKSYWFYLLAFLIQTPNGYLKMNKLKYDNVYFSNPSKLHKPIPCLRIPQNNYDLGIDNERYIEMVKRYSVENIINVERKQKEQIITYSLERSINYALFIHSKFIIHSSFIIKDRNIIEL